MSESLDNSNFFNFTLKFKEKDEEQIMVIWF